MCKHVCIILHITICICVRMFVKVYSVHTSFARVMWRFSLYTLASRACVCIEMFIYTHERMCEGVFCCMWRFSLYTFALLVPLRSCVCVYMRLFVLFCYLFAISLGVQNPCMRACQLFHDECPDVYCRGNICVGLYRTFDSSEPLGIEGISSLPNNTFFTCTQAKEFVRLMDEAMDDDDDDYQSNGENIEPNTRYQQL